MARLKPTRETGVFRVLDILGAKVVEPEHHFVASFSLEGRILQSKEEMATFKTVHIH